MRIISGQHKGRRIQAPKKLPVRPTTDMAKESLFNILNNTLHFSQVSVLDLFAGIGSISFEFASRGSTEITAVDEHSGCIAFIEKIADEIELPIQTVKRDVYDYLTTCTTSFDFIFADPPYNFETTQFEQIHQLVFDRNLLTSNGILVIEHSKHTQLDTLANYQQSRNYGSSQFTFFTSSGQ